MDEPRKFLSDRLLSEELPVTYRLLSRALDLHVNRAKAALHEFHKYQNSLRANSVFATYLISGTKPQQVDADTKSSPEDEGAGHDSPTMTITLVSEDRLQDVLAEYQQVNSIHVYSLSPHPQRDMALLSDVAKTILEYTGKNDGKVDEARKVYGSILNPGARRKERKGGPPIPPPSSAPKPVTARLVKVEPATAAPKASQAVNKVKQESVENPSNGSTPASSAAKKPMASLKRGESGGIMQSFAKAATRPPPQAKPAAKRKKEEEEDTTMAMSDDGEADDSDLPAPSAAKPSTDAEADVKRSRKEREMELRRMMEEDDDDDEEEEKAEAEEEDEEMAEAQELEEAEPEAEPQAKPTAVEKPSEIVSASSNGRRRGKRRVMKKKRILDDKGYMVTIQEEGWESFSEDEPPPPAPAPKPSSTHASTTTPASSGAKAKKSGAKGGTGQGSIMSFFAKK